MKGYIILIHGVAITWCSRNHKTVALSVKEAGYSEVVGVCFEILFVRVILFFMGFIVKYPITVYVDNVVDVFLCL